jgi:hypothetical protein
MSIEDDMLAANDEGRDKTRRVAAGEGRIEVVRTRGHDVGGDVAATQRSRGGSVPVRFRSQDEEVEGRRSPGGERKRG